MKLDPDQVYLPIEVAEILRCGKTNVYDLIASGEIASTRIGAGKRGLRIRGSDIAAFLAERTTGGPSPKSVYKHLGKYLN